MPRRTDYSEFTPEIDELVKSAQPDESGRYATLDQLIYRRNLEQSVQPAKPARFYGRDNSRRDRDA
jgi:hypothetical protein